MSLSSDDCVQLIFCEMLFEGGLQVGPFVYLLWVHFFELVLWVHVADHSVFYSEDLKKFTVIFCVQRAVIFIQVAFDPIWPCFYIYL